jgi:SAM-dependent methyltransferase
MHPKAAAGIHESVRSIITDLFPLPNGRARVLDAGAGNGYMSAWLDEQGFDVTPVDRDISEWGFPARPCTAADLEEQLPFADEIFDLVVAVEVIEHLERPYHLLREFGRVLKPGGYAVITTPNVHSLKSRLKYPILGIPSLFEFVSDDTMGQHITPVSIGAFLYAFDRSGLSLTDIISTGPPRSMTMRILARVINALTLQAMRAIRLRRTHSDDYYLYRLTDSQLRRLIDDMILIVVGRKAAAPSAVQRHQPMVSASALKA